jgi:hypothetical protein
MEKFTFIMTRTYETLLEIEAENYADAQKQLAGIDRYAIELEQCCVTNEDMICEGKKYARQCSITGEGMNEGWVFGDGEEYVKYEQDAVNLLKEYWYESLEDAYKNNAVYWTSWEDEDDYQYQMINGQLEEIQ